MVIRFITENDPISAAIRLVTFSEWSHVEIQTATGWLGAHANGGVEERPADYCQPSRERRYNISLPNEATAIQFARAKIGTPYNFRDIAGLFLHHDWKDAGRDICSMFVFDVVYAGGLQLLNVLPEYSNLVTPENLHLSPCFIGRCIYSYPIRQQAIQ